MTGIGLTSLSSLGSNLVAMAGPFAGNTGAHDHFVPADKRLSRAWLADLRAKGGPRVLRGRELNLVGMPVGGIGAGQVYLCGDGTLGSWQVFNRQYFSGYGRDNYRPNPPEQPIEQGFAVLVRQGDQTIARSLDRGGFPDVEFVGQYPLGRVKYASAAFPVRVDLEAFSPFIPLNARDSALPATVLEYTLTSTADQPVSVGLLGWLENAICHHHVREDDLVIQRRTQTISERGRTLLMHTAAPLPAGKEPPREDIILADFEGGTYSDWTIEGKAFGTKPAAGTLPGQQTVEGHLGKGLVNTFQGGDGPRGRLLSPVFRVSRKYICFLIGGGKHPERTCVNLLIGGQAVRTATGRNRKQLLWHNWEVAPFEGQTAQIEIVDQESGPWGHVNVDQMIHSDRRRFGRTGQVEHLEDFGSMGLALGEPAATVSQTRALLAELGGQGNRMHADSNTAYPSSEKRIASLATRFVELPPGSSRKFTFVLTWHFPNRPEGNRYANSFDDAAQAAHYVVDHHDRLAGETRLWHDTYYDSTLPHWLLDRLHSTVCNLATGTCQWWGNGRFWAWEGVGCCHGTCTHVWNYAQAAARLFPELERSARVMQDLGTALHDDGRVGFRGERNEWYAADGQAGTVLKCLREHQTSADESFLRENWPKIKKVLQYCIRQDGDEDGLIENSQHNTFDINFEGANTFVGSLYLAALRAGEEMAREVGDNAFARRVRPIFESGSRKTIERLFNGEYFIQEVDLAEHPQHQYGPGCLSDQLFGQGWAHQLGLGYLYPVKTATSALESIWKYNWAPDVGPHNAAHRPERWFAYPGEAGLFTCTWPTSEHLTEGVRYRNEVWTGIEYQVAGHMIWEGLVDQGLAMVRAIHDRYNPLRHNPFNEVECGDHYARALASWGVYLAVCGYEYHGPVGRLGFAPRISPEDFRAAFTAAEGWGLFSQGLDGRRQRARLELRWGRLRLTSLALSVPQTVDRSRVAARLRGQDLEAAPEPDDGDATRLIVRFADEVVLNVGDVLEVVVG
ncbi:MAG: hypothetical protein GY778_18960 [bacterium]|nr:hypothetical protein [bacterium]